MTTATASTILNIKELPCRQDDANLNSTPYASLNAIVSQLTGQCEFPNKDKITKSRYFSHRCDCQSNIKFTEQFSSFPLAENEMQLKTLDKNNQIIIKPDYALITFSYNDYTDMILIDIIDNNILAAYLKQNASCNYVVIPITQLIFDDTDVAYANRGIMLLFDNSSNCVYIINPNYPKDNWNVCECVATYNIDKIEMFMEGYISMLNGHGFAYTYVKTSMWNVSRYHLNTHYSANYYASVAVSKRNDVVRHMINLDRSNSSIAWVYATLIMMQKLSLTLPEAYNKFATMPDAELKSTNRVITERMLKKVMHT